MVFVHEHTTLEQKQTGKLDSYIQIVNNNYRFSYVDRQELAVLLSAGTVKNYPKHSYVFMEGDRVHSFHFIMSGKVRVYITNQKLSEKILNIQGPGDELGLPEMFNCHEVHTTTAFCEEQTVLVSVPRTEFRRLIPRLPEFTFAICISMGNMIGILRHELAYKTAQTKVLMYLKSRIPEARKAGTDGNIKIPRTVSNEKLGKVFNISRETVGRVFKRLHDLGVIELTRSHIFIRDEEVVLNAVPEYACLNNPKNV